MDIAQILAKLTLAQKVSLTCGTDFWNIPGVAEAGIPQIRVTDGPNGARGSALLGGGMVSALCVPCGSALGATWDPALVQEVGAALGQEAHTKSCRVLLAPTINLHRSPIAGRNFECYSEDPLLSGKIAAGFVRGVQSQGVAATVKHFVGNEAEFQRNSISSDIDERALRELYLKPFEIAVKEGGVWAVMTAYNRLNSTFCTESEWLLTQVLRNEWGFDGLVMTDWFGVADTVVSSAAGLDLEMPGPGRAYGPALLAAVQDGRVSETSIDAMVTRWLSFIDRVDAWNDPAPTEESVDLARHREIARRASTDSMVLLSNSGILPLDQATVKTLALIGPTAGLAHIMGGGSAELNPHYRVSPVEALQGRLGDRLVYEAGCNIDKSTRALASRELRAPNGQRGIAVDFYANQDWQGPIVFSDVRSNARLLFFGDPAPGIEGNEFSFRATTTYTAEADGAHQLAITQMGAARLIVDGAVVFDGIAEPPPRGDQFFSAASQEQLIDIELRRGQTVDLVIEYTSLHASFLFGAKLGILKPRTGTEMDQAVAAAAAADVAIVMVGTSEEWESEGHDRDTMDLPGDQDELVRRVAAANPKTIVVVNAGSPVTMPWANDVAAVLQVWLGGQEMAAAIDAVLFGDAEPAGRLPTTIPMQLEHNPTYGSFPGENDHLTYGEGLLMGYRWYDTRKLPVRFPFGHGGSYTFFKWGQATTSASTFALGHKLTVTVPLTNTGARRGAEVVQCYMRPAQGPLYRPVRELVGWAKLWLEPGETGVAEIHLDDRAFAHWDPTSADRATLDARRGASNLPVPAGAFKTQRDQPGWWIDPGEFTIEVAASVADIRQQLAVQTEGGRL